MPSTRRYSSTLTRPVSSIGSARFLQARVRRDAGGPDDRRRRDPLAGRERREVSAGLVEPGPEPDVDAAAAQLVDRRTRPAGGRPRAGRGPSPRRGSSACRGGLRARVALDRVGGEVLQLGERLEARVAAADEDVGQKLLAPRRVLGGVRALERLDHVVAQPDRVGQALEPDRVLVEAGNGQRARDRADGDEELVVADLLVLALVRRERQRAGLGVVGGDRAEAQVRALQDVAQRRDDVARLQRPGRRLRQERRVEHEVDVVDEREPRRLARQEALELAGGRHPGEPTSGDDDVPGHDLKYGRPCNTLLQSDSRHKYGVSSWT